MLILLDDIKFNDSGVFFGYINQSFKDKEIFNLDALYDYLTETENEIEFIINDFDDVTPEGRDFANDVMKLLLDVRTQNDKITVTMF